MLDVILTALANLFVQIVFTAGVVGLCGMFISFCNQCFYDCLGDTAFFIVKISGFLGTPVHELSHALMCLIFGHRITDMKIYKENESLCLADTEKKYEIPLSQLRRIKAVNKEIGMILWNKKESFRQSPYSAYNIVKNKKGNYVVPKYYELEFEHEGELWLISFPCYEIDTFQKLTGLTAEY